MNPRYGCVCFAVPKRLLQHLADNEDDPEQRAVLQRQARQSSLLRGSRATATWNGTAPRKGERPLQRRVFDAQRKPFLPGVLLRDEDDPPTKDKAAEQVYENIGIALQFFSQVLHRDSIDNKGMRVDASVHYEDDFPNAMWTGRQMAIGDAGGIGLTGLAGSLGIIAHEFCHGVCQHLVAGGLGMVMLPNSKPALKGEAGALNESFCDVFASMIKQWRGGQDVTRADWLMGEDILKPGAGKAIRSLKEPGNPELTYAKDDQISDYRRFRSVDGPHKASGIANHAFYVAATKLGGFSWETLGPVWLKGFDKLRATSTFLDAAHSTMSVAATLHGKGSGTYEAVKAGWKKVNVLA